jgi:hypothetical protein
MHTALQTPEFASASWFNWEPDPEQTFREHDPTLEPYASMTKQQLLEMMLDATSGREWGFLQEFYLDKCSEAELAVARSIFLREQFGALEEDLFWFIAGVAGIATRVAPDASTESEW